MRSLAALAVILALVAGLPVACACAPVAANAAAGQDQHACCAPATALRAAVVHDCCRQTATSVDAVPAAAPAVVPALLPAQAFLFAAAELPLAGHPGAAPAVPSPPPLILRI